MSGKDMNNLKETFPELGANISRTSFTNE